MFVHPKPGGWTDGLEKITGLEIGTIASQLVNAPDTVGGGIYTIGAGNHITFAAGGGDWIFNCNVSFGMASTVAVAGAWTFSHKATFTAGAEFSNTVTFNSSVNFIATALFLDGITIQGGASSFAGAVTCSAGIAISGANSTPR